MSLRVNDRIEADMISFLKRNYLWEDNEPAKTMHILELVEYREDIQSVQYNEGVRTSKSYYHFTQKGKDFICKLIQNIY